MKGQRRLLGVLLLTWAGTAVSKQILYQPGASSTFVAHKELPFTVQYAGVCRISMGGAGVRTLGTRQLLVGEDQGKGMGRDWNRLLQCD